MPRRVLILGVIAGLIVAQLCAAQPLQVPHACPMKAPVKAQPRCCRMLPAQPSDAVKPQAPQVAVVHAQAPVVAAIVSRAACLPIPPAPAREVPTRTIVLRI